ncbi:MAG: hypothetical protein KIS94_01805 [Chitinophagales bacterium]|nr:hypothetical protein [Chitinophagales bacterium]
MESNADKQLREKLKGVEYPFDPQAWEQMEAMLDEKKKRRGFLWWWFGGIAAGLLLFAVLGYEAGKMVGSRQLAEKIERTNGIWEMGNGKGEMGDGKDETGDGKREMVEGKREKSNVKSKMSNGESESGDRRWETSNMKRETSNTEKQMVEVTTGKGSGNRKTVAKRDKKEAQQLSDEKSVAAEKGSLQTEVPVTSAQTQQEVTALNTMFALLNTKEEEWNAEKKEENLLPKKKRKIFTYSIGPMANVTGTILSNPFADDTVRQRKPFSRGASFMVGFQQEFLFVDRFAFTTSLLYSQTTFDVHKTNLDNNYARAPLSYSCYLNEMNITTGIKANLIAQPNLRWYVHAGFIHHIRLKELFTYRYPKDTIPMNIVANGVVNNTSGFPTQTQFGGNTGYEAVQFDALSNSTKSTTVNTENFSINHAKRYYTSFYAATGVEYIVNGKWVFFTEPMFFMGLQRIGIQERRKYNVGVSGGFRYQF